MKDRDRISNLEELMADLLIRMDRLEGAQNRLQEGQNRLESGHGQAISRLDRMEGILGKLIENQMELGDRQGNFQEALLDLIKVVRKNSTDIEIIKDTMATKDTLAHFMEAMMNRFDKIDLRFEGIEHDIELLKLR